MSIFTSQDVDGRYDSVVLEEERFKILMIASQFSSTVKKFLKDMRSSNVKGSLPKLRSQVEFILWAQL